MKSSTGEYFVGLDHIRALAAFMVFAWHFSAVNDGHLKPPSLVPISIFTEGHVGVALFLCLSGYLFAKLLNGRQIAFLPFFWNRIIRLFPLLLVVFLLVGLILWQKGEPLKPVLESFLLGFVMPVWPNGGWSIAVELHFYMILPLLLLISANRSSLILLVVLAAILVRYYLWREMGQVQVLAYWTIVGGIDQFVFGIFAFKCRNFICGNHRLAVTIAAAFLIFYFLFDANGGFYNMGSFPTKSPIWVIYPTVTGAAFAFLIAWYDGSFRFRDVGISGLIAKIGACSYSIYLLHTFVVYDMARFIDRNLIELTDPAITTGVSFLAFLAFAPIAYCSFKSIELPPMAWKLPYQKSPEPRLGESYLRTGDPSQVALSK